MPLCQVFANQVTYMKNLHNRTRLNLVIDFSLHSQVFRVYCNCIDLDHILVLVIVVLGGYN